MEDLENMLLEAAGRNPASRRGHGGGDGSDSGEDDGHNYSGRKPSCPQVPLKKRFDSKKEWDDCAGESSGETDVGGDLYKNEDARHKLSEMTELQREMIFSNRASKRNDKDLLGKLATKHEKVPEKQSPPLQSSRVCSSPRSADRSTAKDGALSELHAKRLKQQDSEANHGVLEASRSSGHKNVSPERKPLPSTSISSSSDSVRFDSDNDGSSGDDKIIDSDDDVIKLESEELSFEDIKGITIRRSELAKWFLEPFFEELIVDCFVRVGIGRTKSGLVYRLCMVKNVDATDPDRKYKLENKTTHKYLNLVWGNEASAARWQMAMISDSPPLEEEFKQWVKEVERRGGRIPMKQEVEEKKQAIQKKIKLTVYSAATVKRMLQEKKSASSRPLNIAAEKDRLRTEMDIALSNHNEAEVKRIMTRLQELDASREAKVKDVKALKLAEMNRKNRFENLKNATELKPIKIGLKAGEAGYDPFSRRWTRSRNYYAGKPTEEAEVENNSADGGAAADTGSHQTGAAETVVAGMEATAAALKAASSAGKLVDTSAPVDQGTESNLLHNFELPISLTILQNFGGAKGARAGLMAKRQKMEATIGFQVLENDGGKHELALTVSDYKKRRGLL